MTGGVSSATATARELRTINPASEAFFVIAFQNMHEL